MIRVFPRKTKWTPTDELAFVGDPPLIRPPIQPVYVSCTFTWDIEEAKRLASAWKQYYPDVYIGGPAFGDPGGEFEPGRFVKSGVTITSRGCPNKCPWCYVPRREGKIRELEIRPGWIVQDNNLLACSDNHLLNVLIMLQKQKHPVVFSGGLDSTRFTKWHSVLLKSIKVKELWFACDSEVSLQYLEKVRTLLDYPQRKMRCYVMVGFNGEKIEDAQWRLEIVYKIGFDPFCQLYRGEGEQPYGKDWLALNRKWSRPAAYHSKEEK